MYTIEVLEDRIWATKGEASISHYSNGYFLVLFVTMMDVFKGIGNLIGEYIGASDKIQDFKFVTFARIYVHLSLESPLPTIIKINFSFTEVDGTNFRL